MVRRSRSWFPLAESALFADSGSAELERAASLLTPITLQADVVLIHQGSFGNEFMIVSDGLVDVTRAGVNGSESLAMLTPGEVLGEMALLHRVPRSATATTLVPTTVYVASVREFFALLSAVPSVAERVTQAAADRRLANMAA